MLVMHEVFETKSVIQLTKYIRDKQLTFLHSKDQIIITASNHLTEGYRAVYFRNEYVPNEDNVDHV